VYGNIVQFHKSVIQRGDELTLAVEASLTVDPEMTYYKKLNLDKMCKFFKKTSLHFDNSMTVTALKALVFNFTAIYKDFWI
jgi:hypothetical protein